MPNAICDDSYDKHACCGVDCDRFASNLAEPCWGQVECVGETEFADTDGNEDSSWVHSCQGHKEILSDGGTGIYQPIGTSTP